MEIDEVLKSGITHSCYPNSGFNAQNELVLIEPAVPGDRITVDFSTLFTGNLFIFECKCGCNGCRNMILGFDQIPVIFQEKYLELGVVPIGIVKHIENQAFRSTSFFLSLLYLYLFS